MAMGQARARIKIINIDFIELNYSISFQKVKYFLRYDFRACCTKPLPVLRQVCPEPPFSFDKLRMNGGRRVFLAFVEQALYIFSLLIYFLLSHVCSCVIFLTGHKDEFVDLT
jgi:hypothetical protein